MRFAFLRDSWHSDNVPEAWNHVTPSMIIARIDVS
jgi:hypothetical protein